MFLTRLLALKLELQRLWFVGHVLRLTGNDESGEQRVRPNMFGSR